MPWLIRVPDAGAEFETALACWTARSRARADCCSSKANLARGIAAAGPGRRGSSATGDSIAVSALAAARGRGDLPEAAEYVQRLPTLDYYYPLPI
jgi:hypothetical protein